MDIKQNGIMLKIRNYIDSDSYSARINLPTDSKCQNNLFKKINRTMKNIVR